MYAHLHETGQTIKELLQDLKQKEKNIFTSFVTLCQGENRNRKQAEWQEAGNKQGAGRMTGRQAGRLKTSRLTFKILLFFRM
jgi:hypothetical protein